MSPDPLSGPEKAAESHPRHLISQPDRTPLSSHRIRAADVVRVKYVVRLRILLSFPIRPRWVFLSPNVDRPIHSPPSSDLLFKPPMRSTRLTAT